MTDRISRLQAETSGNPVKSPHARPAIRTDLFGYEPLGLVCAALFVAWIALVLRIVSIW